MKTFALQGDTLDAICVRYYGRTEGVVETVLVANPGLAELGAVLPHGTAVELPDVQTAPVTGLIESLSPSGRRRLSAELAKRLRQSQQRRVMAQKAPDGTPYAPRQQQSVRKKTGRVKRKMFAKLITSRFLHIRASPEQASMEFYGGKSPKIASVHQFGLSEENRKDGKKIDYPARPLLGFTGKDVQMIEEIILAHLDR